MIHWRSVPWSLWAYSAVTLVAVVLVEVDANAPVPAYVLFPTVMLVWLYFLLKGVRWFWILTIGIYILGIALDLVSGSINRLGMTFSLIGLLLLLLPVTGRFFFTNHGARSENKATTSD